MVLSIAHAFSGVIYCNPSLQAGLLAGLGAQSLAAVRPFEDLAANIESIQVLQSKSFTANRLFNFLKSSIIPEKTFSRRRDYISLLETAMFAAFGWR